MISLKDDKIILRSVESSDIDTILLWENANNEPLYGIFEEQYSREDVAQFIENQQRYSIAETEQLRLMICSYKGERLGCIDLAEYDGKKASVSILVFSLDNRRKGFATSALRILIEYAKSLGIQTLYATILPENRISLRLFTKAGFEPIGGDIFCKFLHD